MFTGLVQAMGTITANEPNGAGRRLWVDAGELPVATIKAGDSIAVAGVCLTVTEPPVGSALGFDVISETLARTTLGNKQIGAGVNLELSLRAGDPLGGHFVQGHVDAVATVLDVKMATADWRITFSLPQDCRGLLVDKGSVALDGVSMTVARVTEHDFAVAVIPTTLRQTTLGRLRPGENVNVETDILARTILNYLRNMMPQHSPGGALAGTGVGT